MVLREYQLLCSLEKNNCETLCYHKNLIYICDTKSNITKNSIMKKVFAILAVASAFAFASCGSKTEGEHAEGADTTAKVEEMAAPTEAESSDTTKGADTTKTEAAPVEAAKEEAKH